MDRFWLKQYPPGTPADIDPSEYSSLKQLIEQSWLEGLAVVCLVAYAQARSQWLADGITQGEAQGEDWRTAPLWGLGDRLFLLHDGRTKDLTDAIRLHDSPGSEARQVIRNFDALPMDERRALLEFLRSL